MKRKLILLLVLLIVLVSAAGAAHADTTSVSGFTGATYKHNSAFANAIIIDGVEKRDMTVLKKHIDF